MDTIAELLLARAGDGRPGMAVGDERWSWDEIVSGAGARAALLTERRAGGPFHVATLLDNVPEHVLWLGGAALVGAVVVGGNSTHRGEDLARDLAHTECQLLVTDRAHLPLVDGLDLGLGIGTVGATSPRVLVIDDDSYRAELATYTGAPLPDPSAFGVDEDSLGHLIFTSGTSGAPKACRCTQGRLARIGIIVAQMFSLTAEDVCYVSMPLFHSNALMAGLSPTVAAGATIALPSGGRFSASGFLADVRHHGVTYFNYVGKPLSYILATPEQPDDGENTLVRVFGNEGAEADIVAFGERFGCLVVDSYGSTEGGATVQRTPDTPRGALGRAPEGTMVVDPETGQECPVARFDADGVIVNSEEAVGELVSMSGASGFEGYWHNDEAEVARLRNGWYWTGDLAYRDEAGFFYFAGRSDDWLRVDGENFAAAPVARIMERHPDVVLAAVYAVPDPDVGDQVMTAIQLRPGAVFEPGEFATFLETQSDLGTKWAPRFVRVCRELPITATSKVLVRTLRVQRWNSSDPVWWRPGRDAEAGYRPLENADVDALEEAVARR
ncbi:MAG TPA: long-chain-fatty-acid--CoA ligase [Acidimicrobiales bacterium]|nr:long-chain-fatty-acid--CoA ligase [Acidimicrobiales bacterium]